MLKAKIISLNELDEYEVVLEVNNTTLVCFAVVCPYKINIGGCYPIEVSLKVSDDVEPLKLSEKKHAFEKTGFGYEYILRGIISGNKLDMGVFSIQDDFLKQFPMLEGKYVEIPTKGLWVTFLPKAHLNNN